MKTPMLITDLYIQFIVGRHRIDKTKFELYFSLNKKIDDIVITDDGRYCSLYKYQDRYFKALGGVYPAHGLP